MAISDAQFKVWLEQDSTSRVLLVEAVYYDSGSEHTVYMSNGIFVSDPTDTPASMPYDDVIRDIPQFSSQLSDALEGFTVPSWGDIIISNELFAFDDWLDYAWDGRRVTLLYGDSSWPKADFRTILSGTIAEVTSDSSSTLKMSIRDKQWMLNVPVQSKLVGEPELVSGTTYKVSDSAVTSIDSVWDNGTLLTLTSQYTVDVANGRFTLVSPAVGRVTAAFTDNNGNASIGSVIPLCFGQCFNVTPIQINASLLKYQVHDGPIEAITAVRDNGVPVPYTVNLSTGTFILTYSPVGVVTADVKGAKPSTYLTKVGDIVNHIVTTRTELTSGDIDSTSLSAFITLCPQLIGLYLSGRANVIDVIDKLITSVGGWYSFNRSGKLILGRMDVPSGTTSSELVADDIIFGGLSLSSQSMATATERIGYSKNYTIQNTTAGSLTPSEKLSYYQPIKIVSANNQSVRTTHLLAIEPDLKETLLVTQSNAQAEANRLLGIWQIPRKTFTVECIISPLTINLGDVVLLTHPRYGLSDGKLLRVIGIRESVTTRRIALTLWG